MAVLKVTIASATEYDASSFISVDSKTNLVQSDMNRYDFDLNDTEAEKIFNSGKTHIIIRNFPIRPDYKVDLVLSKQKSAFTKDVEIKYYKDGKKTTYDRKNKDKYFGHIAGAQKSDVFLGYSSVGLIGYIQDDMGIMYDVSSDLTKLGSEQIPHNVAETTAGLMLDKMPVDQCGIDPYADFDPESFVVGEEKLMNEVQSKDELYEVKMAADANFEYYLMFCWFVNQGSYSNWEDWFFDMSEDDKQEAMDLCLDYIDNIMSASSRIYNREVALLLNVPYVTVFNDPIYDPYFNLFGETLGDKLGAMPTIWQGRQNEAQDRTLATLFSDVNRQPAKSTTLGIAQTGGYKGVLGNKNSGYSALGMRGNVNFPRVSFSTDVQVAAHEFGHNFSCPHTHFCGWPSMGASIIDSCVSESLAGDAYCISSTDRRTKQDGTIMSYCHFGGSIVYNFHPRLRDRIRSTALKAVDKSVYRITEPTVVLIRPLGEEVYFANGTTKIAFNAANVSKSKLYYSRNNGVDWIEIAEVNSDADTTYEWSIPAEVGDRYMVRIESSSDPSVFDQSVLPFEVTDFSVNPDYPQPGSKLGYLAEQRLSWVKQNVGSVNVKYSVDNGDSWKTIVSDKDINSFDYNFPNTAVENALFLVESVENPTVNMEIPFTLGMETVDFTKPQANDTVNISFKDFEVRYNRDFINDEEFDIYLVSGDDESSITNFANKVNLEDNNFIWEFKSDLQDGQAVQLEARVNGTVVGETGIFYLGKLTSVREFSEAFRISSITPNPAENSFNLTVSNGFGKLMNTTIRIIGTDGKVHRTIANKFMGSGASSPIKIDVSELSVGTYYVIIESDKYKDVQQLKVIR